MVVGAGCGNRGGGSSGLAEDYCLDQLSVDMWYLVGAWGVRV